MRTYTDTLIDCFFFLSETRVVQSDDIAFVEANALTEIHRQINGSLGSVPF